MLVFRKILRTHCMNDPYWDFQYIINSIVLYCNNLHFLHYFHHHREKPLKMLTH